MIQITSAQIEVLPGEPHENYKKIKKCILEAKKNKTDILIFPELSLSGYLIGDLWEQTEFLNDCMYYGNKILDLTENICVIFGNIALDKNKKNNDGHYRKYNAAFIFYNKKNLLEKSLIPFVIKNSLPNYREFDDSRYFYTLEQLSYELEIPTNELLNPIEIEIRNTKLKIGLLICEDGWTENYRLNIPKKLAKNGADILVNISCSPFTLNKNIKRNSLFSAQASKLSLPLVYCNNVGIQNNGKNIFTFDGSSSIYSSFGELLYTAPVYKEILIDFNFEANTKIITLNQSLTPSKIGVKNKKTAAIYNALYYGLKKFFEQLNIKKITIGASGGIDSAITAALFTKVLGPENVLLVNMPSKFNSSLTINLVEQMAKKLKTNYISIPIQQSVDYTIEQITSIPATNLATNENFKLEISSFIVENIQSRDRGSRLIAAIAACFGGVFSCNSNKTELSIGYATFYGDISGAVAPIADLWKHQVYDLGHYLNSEVYKEEVIPSEIFNIKPSAELSAEQTVGIGGDPLIYQYHDYLFKSFIENWQKLSPADILEAYLKKNLAALIGCNQELIENNFPTSDLFIKDLEKWWKLFSGFAVAKRIQAPPILTVSARSYGLDFKESQIKPYFSRKYKLLKDQALNEN